MNFTAKVQAEAGNTRVIMAGMLDERCELPSFPEVVKGHLILDLEGVTLINSLGCRKWTQWMRGLKSEKSVILSRCSPMVVKQINILAGFLSADARIESIYVPYYCEDCGLEEQKLVELATLSQPFLPAEIIECYSCPACGKNMQLDMIKSQYFAFLSKQASKLNRA